MLHYDRIDVGNDVAKSTNNKKDIIFHYCFFSHRVKFQNSVSNGWHNVTILWFNTILQYCYYQYCNIVLNHKIVTLCQPLETEFWNLTLWLKKQ